MRNTFGDYPEKLIEIYDCKEGPTNPGSPVFIEGPNNGAQSWRWLRRSRRRSLDNFLLVRGAIQVPPDGDPIMMLADHPTTGGYPVIAVVDPDDVAIVAQLLPGSTVRFT